MFLKLKEERTFLSNFINSWGGYKSVCVAIRAKIPSLTGFCLVYFSFLWKLALSCHSRLQEIFFFAEIFSITFFCVRREGWWCLFFFIIIILFELSHFQTYCLYCSCWFLTQGDLNHLSCLSFLPLCRLLGCTAGNWILLFFSSFPPPNWFLFQMSDTLRITQTKEL